MIATPFAFPFPETATRRWGSALGMISTTLPLKKVAGDKDDSVQPMSFFFFFVKKNEVIKEQSIKIVVTTNESEK